MDVKFRGVVKENGNHFFSGDWVYGSLIEKTAGVFIYVIEEDDLLRECEVEVIPESIGKKLKSTDKSGGELFVGDICKIFNENSKLEDDLRAIEDKGDFFALDYSSQPLSVLVEIGCSFEVVGNIFENPDELLGQD